MNVEINTNKDKQKKFDLEERLIEFTLRVIEIVEQLPDNRVGNYFAGQLLRSGASPTLNYGEAQAAESRNDFIHKMKVCLKELRETNISLKIINKKPLIKQTDITEKLLIECNELISIFVKSIQTAEGNRNN